MDVTPAPEHRDLRQHVTELLDDELAPLIRRMADRPRHTAEPDNTPIRAMVWQALTDLGLLRLNQSPAPGALRALQGLTAVAERLGEVLYHGPFTDTVLTSEALLRAAPDGGHDHLLKEIGAGVPVAAAIRDGSPAPHTAPLTPDATGQRITAERRFVVCAAEADWLLIPGRTPDGTHRTALVRRDHPSVRLHRHEELSRGELYTVTLTATPVLAWLDLDTQAWHELTATARVLQAAYLVGLSRAALHLGVTYAGERRQFGAPIGRQQSLAFGLARLATRVDAASLLTQAAAWEADTGADAETDTGADTGTTGAGTGATDADNGADSGTGTGTESRLTAAQALAMAAELARDATRQVLHLHGAHGMTTDCDAQLFYRRAAWESLALGSPAHIRAEVLPLLRGRVGGAG